MNSANPHTPPPLGCGYLSSSEVEQLVEGRLPAERQHRFESHLAGGCGPCALLAADLEVFRTLETDGLQPAERRAFEARRQWTHALLRREMRRNRRRTAPRSWALGTLAAAFALAALLLPVWRAGTISHSAAAAVIEPMPLSSPLVLRGEQGLPALWQAAAQAYAAGRWDRAASLFGEIAARRPALADARLYQGISLLLAHDPATARRVLRSGREVARIEGLPCGALLWYEALAALKMGDRQAADALLIEAAEAGGIYANRARELADRLNRESRE